MGKLCFSFSRDGIVFVRVSDTMLCFGLTWQKAKHHIMVVKEGGNKEGLTGRLNSSVAAMLS